MEEINLDMVIGAEQPMSLIGSISMSTSRHTTLVALSIINSMANYIIEVSKVIGMLAIS